ncbi:MAG: hypothetical protein NT133_25445 [Alphaproteobacteria bacterium]|nr:hypothetical protein [Alphaproteobacteria bacterium]
MPVTNFTITNQHDLLLAAAAIGLNGAADYTFTLANDVILAGTIGLNSVSAGQTVTLEGNGHTLLGGFTLNVQAFGAGTLVLNAASTSSGGVNFYGAGTLELARADAAGYGIITLNNSYQLGPPTVLKIDSGAIPVVPIALTGSPFYYAQPNLNEVIDLVGVVAVASFTTVDAGYGLVIPTATGSVVIETLAAPGATFLLTPDGAGGTMVQQTILPVAGFITVAGAAGSTVNVAFASPTLAPQVQAAIAPLNAAVTNGSASSFVLYPGASIPAFPAGNTLEIIAASPGDYTLPTGPGAPTTAFISNLSAPVSMTVTGGDADGQIVLAGGGGLTFTGGLGAGSVFAGGADNAVTLPAGAGRQAIALGDGNNTIRAFNGADTITTGRGSNFVWLGVLGSTVVSVSADTIVGGTASDYVSTSGAATTFLSDAGSTYCGSGAGTVLGGAGSDTISTFFPSTSLIFLGSGNANVYLGGNDTLVTGSGSSTVSSSASSLVFTESGQVTMIMPTGGTTTVVGNPAQTLSVSGDGIGDLVVFGYGAVNYDGYYASGAATVISAGPAVTVRAGFGGGAFIGGSAGGNVMQGTAPGWYNYAFGTALLIGGGNGDTLSGGAGPTVLEPAAGTSTLIGGAFIDELAFRHGVVANSVVQSFDPTYDFIALFGFPAGEAAAALSTAVIAGGNESLTLSDGTHILFQGFTGLTAADFH